MPKKEDYVTYQEITSQADTLKQILDRLDGLPIELRDYHRIILTGCGSSFFLSQLIAHFLRTRLNLPCRAVPSSELIFYPEAYLEPKLSTAVFAFSRTGSTTETVRAVQMLQEKYNLLVVAVTCYDGSEITQLGGPALVFPEVQEKSVVMTRAFTGILGAFLHWAGAEKELEKVPGYIARSLADYDTRIQTLAAQDFHHVVFLGTGPLYYVAREGMLKLEEMTARHTEAWQSFEFRHGPKAILEESTLIWLFSSRQDAGFMENAVEEFTGLGAHVWLAGNRLPQTLAAKADEAFVMDWDLERPEIEAVSLLHLPQLYAFYRSLQVGNNPDEPAKLSRVVKL